MSAIARKRLGVGLEVLVPIGLIALWALLSAGSESFYFPPLTEILEAFADNWLFERVVSDALPSLARMAAGFAIAAVLAIGAGLVLGTSRRARIAADPIVEFLRAIPPPALLPFAILVIGVGASMKIFIIAFVCIWPILLNVIDGIGGVDPTLRETARSYGIPRRQFMRSVLIPAAAPQVFAGLRVSLSLALIMMVISEMVASTNGIGYFVLEAQRTFAIPEMWSGIILLGILGYALNLIFTLIERRALRWHRGAKSSALG